MKTHISLPTIDLEKSVAFYSALLDTTPAKLYADYALFISERSGLELALNRANDVAPCSGTHYGLAVESTEAVDAATARLKAAGLQVEVEIEETCCYAKQNKVWVSDPDGRRWETYAVLEEVPESAESCCGSGIG